MSQELSEESVLYKTLTSVEKMPDGTCLRKITETKNGKTFIKEEQVDCESAIQGLKEKDDYNDDHFRKENDDFDLKMREKLKELNKSFSDGSVQTKVETVSDGANKIMKVTRESSSIEETRKNEKIPDGTRRILKVTRDSFLEETSKTVESYEPEKELDGVKMLDESFTEEYKDNKEQIQKSAETEVMNVTSTDDTREQTLEVSSEEEEISDKKEGSNEEDGIFSKVMKILLFPLYKLGVL